MFKKLFVLSSVVIILFSSFVSFGKTSYASENPPDWETIFSNTDEELTQAANKVSSYFDVDEDDNIIFTADRETLVNELGVSEEDADLMILAAEELPQSQFQTYGFVGVYLHLGPKVRKMNGWAAGAFAAGYVGWYAKKFAVNPVTAGVAGIITAGTGVAVKYAVENGIRSIPVGKNIPGYRWSYNVNIP